MSMTDVEINVCSVLYQTKETLSIPALEKAIDGNHNYNELRRTCDGLAAQNILTRHRRPFSSVSNSRPVTYQLSPSMRAALDKQVAA